MSGSNEKIVLQFCNDTGTKHHDTTAVKTKYQGNPAMT